MINDILAVWAIRHRVSHEALEDLRQMLGFIPETNPEIGEGRNEMFVQNSLRLQASNHNATLFRNNVGVLLDDTGRPVRFGLANDTKAMNEVVKSGDLIGYTREHITQAHVGTIIARFTSIECKRPGWTYSGDEHEKAQARWAGKVNADGGFAAFSTGTWPCVPRT